MNVCSVDGCDGKVRGHGLCNKHYLRWWKHGDPLVTKIDRNMVVRRTLAEHPAPTPQPTPCRIWQGQVRKGYGYRGDGSRVHRWVMEQALGRPLTDQEVVMHLCDNRPCFRFDHLRVGTIAENNADMVAKGRNRKGPIRRG